MSWSPSAGTCGEGEWRAGVLLIPVDKEAENLLIGVVVRAIRISGQDYDILSGQLSRLRHLLYKVRQRDPSAKLGLRVPPRLSRRLGASSCTFLFSLSSIL